MSNDLAKGKYWTKTWNVFTGCTPVRDPANPCEHCWALALTKRCPKVHGDFRPAFHAERLSRPCEWTRPEVVFCNNMSDWMHPAFTDQQRETIFSGSLASKQHVYLTLTKRWSQLGRFVHNIKRAPRPDVWWGMTAWDAPSIRRAYEVSCELSESLPRWLSLEPLLGDPSSVGSLLGNFDWVVVGCESGQPHRRCDLEWVREVVGIVREAGNPVWVKQLEVGGKVSNNPSEWPEDLRVRELPPELERILRP
jgi:protein gp37